MKTAVSIPDDVFRKAEAAARRLKISRSKLYATAISELLQRESEQSVTARLDECYARRPAKLDPALHRGQLKSLEKERW
jgi:predicted transcriptional regulator